MNIPIYKLDSFTGKLFHGNPAAVCPLPKWLSDSLMQQIASENNLSETAFFVTAGNRFHIRWFTPLTEVDLCGHATLAAAAVLYEKMHYSGGFLEFESRSGLLKVSREEDRYVLDFPTDRLEPAALPKGITDALGFEPLETWKGREDYLLLAHSEQQIREMKPDFRKMAGYTGRGIIVTSKSEECDFVSRFFAPAAGIDEDPVTGSAHTSLTPYWAERLGKKELSARQLSLRGGELNCKLEGNRTCISGKVAFYLEGQITVQDV